MAAQRLEVCLVGVVPRATQSPVPQSTTSQKRPLHPIHTLLAKGGKYSLTNAQRDQDTAALE